MTTTVGHHRGHADHRVGATCRRMRKIQPAIFSSGLSPQAPEAGEGRRGWDIVMREARRRRTTKPMSHAMTRRRTDADPPQQVGVLRRGPKLWPPALIYVRVGGGSMSPILSHRRPPISASRHQRKDVCFTERDAHSPRIRRTGARGQERLRTVGSHRRSAEGPHNLREMVKWSTDSGRENANCGKHLVHDTARNR